MISADGAREPQREPGDEPRRAPRDESRVGPRRGSREFGRLVPAVVSVVALAAGLAGWWVLARADEPSPADRPPVRTTLRVPDMLTTDDANATGDAAARLAVLADGARAATPLSDGDERVDDAVETLRRGAGVVAWWGVPLEPGQERLSCEICVVDGDDRPVPGAIVELESGGWRARRVTVAGTTDASGCLTVSPPRDVLGVVAHVPGLGCSGDVSPWERGLNRSGSGVIEPGWFPEGAALATDQPRRVVVPLQPELHVTGRVARSDGGPLEEVRVLVDAHRHLQPLPDGGLLVAGRDEALVSHDAEGRFSVDLHAADGASLQAFVEKRESRSLSASALAAATGEVLLTVEMEERAEPEDMEVSGIVIDAAGAPVVGMPVQFWRDGDRRSRGWQPWGNPWDEFETPVTAPFSSGVWTSGAGGRFAVPVARNVSGWFTFAASAAPIIRPLRAVIGDAPRDEPFVLTVCTPAAISGRVIVPPGTPLADVWVWALPRWPADASAELRAVVPPESVFGATSEPVDVEGRFAFTRLHPDGRYDLVYQGVAGRTVWRGVRTDVAAGTSGLRLEVAPDQWLNGVLRVAVRAAGTGESIRLRRDDERWRPTFVLRHGQPDRTTVGLEDMRAEDVDGVCVLRGLRVGEPCDLLVQADGYGDLALRGVVPTPEGTSLDAALPDPGALELQVMTRGAPAPWAIVVADCLEHADLLLKPRAPVSTRTDDAGHVLLADLEPGRWRVLVTLGRERTQRDLTVPAGDTARETLALD